MAGSNPFQHLYPYNNLPPPPQKGLAEDKGYLLERRKVPLRHLRNLAESPSVRTAIRLITNGIMAMPFNVMPPPEDAKKDSALKLAKTIRHDILHPNEWPQYKVYRRFISAIVREILVLNYIPIERVRMTQGDRLFSLTPINGEDITQNRDWTPENRETEYLFHDHRRRLNYLDSEVFLIQDEASMSEMSPPSLIQVIYQDMEDLLALGEQNRRNTSRPKHDYAIHLEGATPEEIVAFRSFWESEKNPKFGSHGSVNVLKLTAAGDEALFLKYREMLLRVVAVTLGLSPRDLGLTDHDNRATATEAANSTFQNATLPMATLITDHWKLEVVEFWFPGFELQLNDTEPRGETEETALASTQFKDNAITRNEYRMAVGLDPLGPQGDVFADGTPLLPEDEVLPPPPPPKKEKAPIPPTVEIEAEQIPLPF